MPTEPSRSPHQTIRVEGMYAPSGYAHAMLAGRTLYVAGQVARDEHGTLIGPGDVEVQGRVVYAHVGRILAAAGARPHDVVKVTTYLADAVDARAAADARLAFFGEHRPPHTGLVVGLGEGVRLEVEVIAVLAP